MLVTDDPTRTYGGIPGQLITVHDPDESADSEELDGAASVLRFIPETGNTGTGGGAYLLLEACPGCSTPDIRHEVPTQVVTVLADLARYPRTPPGGRTEPDPDQVPIEFYGDPGHAADCPLADLCADAASDEPDPTAHRRTDLRRAVGLPPYRIDPAATGGRSRRVAGDDGVLAR